VGFFAFLASFISRRFFGIPDAEMAVLSISKIARFMHSVIALVPP